MPKRHNIFFHGLGIALRRLPAFIWTYVFNLSLAFLVSLPFHHQLSEFLGNSLAAQRISGGFDLGTVAEIFLHINKAPGGSTTVPNARIGVFLFLALYFILVPGTLFCYITRTRARLGTLLRRGLIHFWRFVRITLIALVVCGIILWPLWVLLSRWAHFVDDKFVGRTSLVLLLIGGVLFLLVASLLRLYFDLVEVYTVQLGTLARPNGKPDRRVRLTLKPAWSALSNNLLRIWSAFLLLAILGFAASAWSARTVIHMLAQPRFFPMFFVAQAGLFVMLFMRFWQRGMETSLALQRPIIVSSRPGLYMAPHLTTGVAPPPPPPSAYTPPADPIPDPEPAVPSLNEPDPGVFHHEPHKLAEPPQ
jgi:hypothetical protein